jgi:hypothetical protein
LVNAEWKLGTNAPKTLTEMKVMMVKAAKGTRQEQEKALEVLSTQWPVIANDVLKSAAPAEVSKSVLEGFRSYKTK